MGFNQHTRGTWANNMIYNVHLLVGKIVHPGYSPFSLTGQPSACGTAREVGTFSHRLPGRHGGHQPRAPPPRRRDLAAARRHHPHKIGLHAVAQSRALKDGKLKCLLDQHHQQHAGRPQHQPGIYPGWRNPANFVVVSDVYPTVSALAADLILPSAMWVEKEGAFGNAERRTAGAAPAGQGAGRGQAPTCGSSWSSPSASRSRTCGRPS